MKGAADMKQDLLKKAEDLADRPYQMMTFRDTTTDGERVHVALIPELPGCASHGKTVPEAQASLNEAKVEFIYFLLEDGIAVPEPQLLRNSQAINLGDYTGNVVDQAAQAANRILQYDFTGGSLSERQLAQG